MSTNPQTSNNLSGGQLIVRALQTHGVQRLFCVPGESYLPVLDALHDSPIQTIVCRHEGGAAMMAEASAKLSLQPGICLVTRGPGASNACAGVHVMFGSMVKWVAEIDHPSRIDEFITRAFYTATSGRPGPVVLALPESTLSATTKAYNIKPWKQIHTHPSVSDIEALTLRLQNAKAPLIIVGGSRWDERAVKQLQDFSVAWQVPVACSFRRQQLFDHTHPNYAGDVGIGLNPLLSQRVQDSDLLILIGGRFSEMPSQDYQLIDIQQPQQALVHVYPGDSELGKVYHAELSINASPVKLMEALSQICPPAQISEQRKQAVTLSHTQYKDWSSAEIVTPGEVQMASLMRILQQHVPADTIVTNGAGNYASWVHRFWKFRGFGSQLAPTSGSMGYGLPAAIAAKLSRPENCVIAFAGDGCLQMTLQEIGTAMQYKANIIIIVIDNGMYGTIRMHQERHFPGRVSGTDLHNPDFVALACAYGAQGALVEQTDQFRPALQLAMVASVPFLIHVKTSPEAITPSATLSQIRSAARQQE